MQKEEKRWLEILLTREAARDFNLDISKLVRVRRNGETLYVYKELISKELYAEVNREEWKLQKRRQRLFQEMKENGETLLSLDASLEDFDFEIPSEVDVEEEAIKHLMLMP